MIIIHLTKVEGSRYITLAESIKLNGNRHYNNGIKYLKMGCLHCAIGSFKKANRNWLKAIQLGFRW